MSQTKFKVIESNSMDKENRNKFVNEHNIYRLLNVFLLHFIRTYS